LLGAGFALDDTTGDVNALGFGLGLRGGYTLEKWFVGARLMAFLGGSTQIPTGELAMSTWLLAADLGYNFDFAGMLLQPGLALGVAVRDVAGPPTFAGATSGVVIDGADSDSDGGLYIAPGASLIVPLSMLFGDLDWVFVGGDARLHFVLGDTSYGGFELLINAGIRL
jgi:hypothetical protein